MSRLNRPFPAVVPCRFVASCATVAAFLSPAWSQTTGPLSAQQPETLLPAISVTARKNPDQSTLTQPDLPTARRRIEQTPGGVGVVDAKVYGEGRVSTLLDAVGSATGVFVQPRFGAEEARVAIRGSGLQRTFHGRGLKLMQDGVPLNLADGSFDFQAVEALSARYVEIWRGANALQYGAGNLGGAINFVSPNGYNSDRFRVRAEAGSFDYRRAQLSTGDVSGAFDYYLSTSLFQQHGFRDHARQDTRRNFANLGWQINPHLETRFYLGHVDSESELPGAITRAQLDSGPRQANAGNVSGDQHRDIRWTRVSNKTVYRDGGQQIELFVYASDKNLHHPIFDVIEQRNQDLGWEARYNLDGQLGGRRNRLTLGLAQSVGRTQADQYRNVAGAAGARTNQSRQTARNLELYAENQHHVLPAWALVTGLQAVSANRRLVDQFVPTGQDDESSDRRYRAVSPKLGVRWDYAPRVQFFSNLSRSFEPPSLSEITAGTPPVPNRAQRATTLEIGGRGRLDSMAWDAALYESRVTDELLQITRIGSSDLTVNAPRTQHRGVELGLNGQTLASMTGMVQWRLNALWNDFRFRGDPSYGDKQLPGLPRYAARGQLGYRWANSTLLAVNVEGAGGYPIDFANSFGAKGYAIWGLKLAGNLTPDAKWFVDGRNLADKHYAAATGVVRDRLGADGAYFLPGDGRSVYIGMDWTYK